MAGLVQIRVERLEPHVRLSEQTASGMGIAVLTANPDVDQVVVAAYDAQGVPQEWTIRRAEVTGAGWMPDVKLTTEDPVPATPVPEVVHDQGESDGLEAARANDDEGDEDE